MNGPSDNELLDGLQVLTDRELARVQAHLAAGLPMKLNFGWGDPDEPSCFGCLVGVAMPSTVAGRRMKGYVFGEGPLWDLAFKTFPGWVLDRRIGDPFGGDPNPFYVHGVDYEARLPDEITDRLAGLADQEWRRRHPIEAEETVVARITVEVGA